MILIDERLPERRLHAEAVLYARRFARLRLRARLGKVADAALLFGFDPDARWDRLLSKALQSTNPVAAAAEVIDRDRGSTGVVVLGHDAEHVRRCHSWLQARRDSEPAFAGILATDLQTLLTLAEAFDLATAAAPSDPKGSAVPILIEGETGTGKELLARAIHDIWAAATRSALQLQVVHVAGFSPDLIGDELFGHRPGAFTGAQSSRKGRLEAADGSTLLIDEVGDLPAGAQVRLLRFLQDQKLSRLGTNDEVQVQVRVLAATWHDLDDDVAKGRFRLDLLHRLRVGRLRLPPLRERPRAFDELVPKMLGQLGQTKDAAITRSALNALALHRWPGNLRELNGVLRVALASAGGTTVRLEDLPAALQRPYLERPLHARAVGFLSDEVEEQPLTRALAQWRVEQVDADLHGLPAPAASQDLVAVREFFHQMPDRSPEHRATVEALDSFVVAHQLVLRDQRVVTEWRAIREAGLHPALLPVVDAKLTAAEARLSASEARARGISVDSLVSASPWWKLADDLRSMPFFAKHDRAAIMQGLVTLIGVVYSVAPDVGDRLRALVKDGGLPALRRRAADLLAEGAQDVSSGGLVERVDHRAWKRAEWVALVEAHQSKAAASRATGIDTKTITKHLAKLRVPETWGQRPPPQTRSARKRTGR